VAPPEGLSTKHWNTTNANCRAGVGFHSVRQGYSVRKGRTRHGHMEGKDQVFQRRIVEVSEK